MGGVQFAVPMERSSQEARLQKLIGDEGDAGCCSSLSRRFHAPLVYFSVTCALTVGVLGGFAPAVILHASTGMWWLNPVKRVQAWGVTDSFTMNSHCLMAGVWVVISVWQMIISQLMMDKQQVGLLDRIGRFSHRVCGYVGALLCLAMIANAFVLTYLNGVSGKLLNNFIALIVGSGMVAHLIPGIRAAIKKDFQRHKWHMCGLYCWACFPGVVRSFGILPLQALVGLSCDVTYAGGTVWTAGLVCLMGQTLMRYGLLKHGPRGSFFYDFFPFGITMVADVVVSAIDGSFFACPDVPLMAQVPGHPWELEPGMLNNDPVVLFR